MKAMQLTSSQTQRNGKPSGCATGLMLKARSTYCIKPIHKQSGIINRDTSLTSIRNKARNGTRKCPKTKTNPTPNHVPLSRTTYQKVSSGIFAFQITKYWLKWM